MILVTGASGFIGLHLVRALAAEGRPVRALVRSDEGEERVLQAAASAETVRGELADAESLHRAAAGCELVYHLAGPYRGSPAELHSSHVAGTARLLRAVEPAARVVLVSSTSVYGWERDWPADHATAPQPTSAYGKAKLGAERLVQARPEGNVVVARPTITYGLGDSHGMLARAVRLLGRGLRRFPGSGDNRIHLLHVDDLVNALILLGNEGDGVFVLGGPEARPLREILELLAAGAGLRPPVFGLPTPVLRPVVRGLETAWSLIGADGEAPISVHSLDVATRDRAYASQRAQDELGWVPKVSLEEGIPPVGAWLATLSPARRTVPGFEAAAGEGRADALGFDWRGYFEDPDEGLGTVYERFALADVLESAVARTEATSVLHAPMFGMMGIPGLDAVFLAGRGMRVGLLDFDAERLAAVRSQWVELGLEPETHLVPGPDPSTWPEGLPAQYDLVFSFAALWWFDDPWGVLAAQARWADKGVLSCVPNKNVFMRMRARLWHQGLFQRLNEEALDAGAQAKAATELGLQRVDTGLFDIPPFPDTSVPLAKVLRGMLGKQPDAPPGELGDGVWRWSILPYLKGDQADLKDRIDRLGVLERHLPQVIAPTWAHHRYTLFVTSPASPGTNTGAAPLAG